LSANKYLNIYLTKAILDLNLTVYEGKLFELYDFDLNFMSQLIPKDNCYNE